MKFKYTTRFLGLVAAAAAFVGLTACNDNISDDLRAEAKIEPYSFTVQGTGLGDPEKPAPVFRTTFSDDGHTIYIRVPENTDVKAELNGAVPTFYLSMGATVSPKMTEPQDFSDLDNPVVYAVTSGDGKTVDYFKVTYMLIPPTCVPYGEGFTAGSLQAYKTYTELGFPGEYGSWTNEERVVRERGDILGSPAFCGMNHIVVFSARYAWGGSEADPANAKDAASGLPIDSRPEHAFKVFDVNTLENAGPLNLGSINPYEVIHVTSDWCGNMVAAVGHKASGKTDFYYWTSPDAAPVHVGTADVSVEIGNHFADAGSYINVAGDITGVAVIAAAAPRDDLGSHYKFNTAGGRLLPGHTVIQTGHSANDNSWFQMISFFGTKDSDPYLVGDCEANGNEDNGQICVYLNNANGTNRGTMDYHNLAVNGWKHDDGEVWWSRSGQWLKRGGGRRPTVHAMVLNGKPYSYFTTGSAWRSRGVLMTQELDDGIEIEGGEKYPFPHWGMGKLSAAKSPSGDGGIYLGHSFGCMADWCFDDVEQYGYVAHWTDRFGLVVFKITCLEL